MEKGIVEKNMKIWSILERWKIMTVVKSTNRLSIIEDGMTVLEIIYSREENIETKR